ncbi:hypothetical protein OFO87_29995, partial [Escherichia coli]|nr:hypothetical protein [Escherichia coli]
GRGGSDLRTSHDFEDIVYLMDNCSALNEAVLNTTDIKLQKYLSGQCKNLLINKNIDENIEAALRYGMEERLDIIKEAIERISNC